MSTTTIWLHIDFHKSIIFRSVATCICTCIAFINGSCVYWVRIYMYVSTIHAVIIC